MWRFDRGVIATCSFRIGKFGTVKHQCERLDSWLKRTGTHRDDFAARIGVTLGALSRYCQEPSAANFRCPHRDAMSAIYVATNGAVTPTSFYNLPDLEPRRSAPADETQLDLVEMVRESEAA